MFKDSDLLNHFNKIDIFELDQKIRDFKNIDIRNLTDEEIHNAIYDVLTHENQFYYIPQIRIYPQKTNFYRVRPLKETHIPNEYLHVESDFWNPPNECVRKQGRLNKPYESLLYTATDPVVAKLEAKINKDDFYSVIIYEAKDDIKVNCIGAPYNYSELGIDDRHIMLINNRLNDFLKDEFSREVGIGTEYLYKVSEMIAKDFFDLPPRDIQDAWAYSSLFSKSKYNVCFRPEIAKEKLHLRGALIAKNNDIDAVEVICVAHGYDESGKVLLHNLGTKIQKEIFPEIKVN